MSRPRKHHILGDQTALRKAIEVAGSQAEFCRQHGIPRSTLYGALNRGNLSTQQPPLAATMDETEASPEEIIAQETQVAKERAKERVFNELMQERVKTEILVEKIVDAVKALPNQRIQPPQRSHGPFDDEEAVLLISDVQGGQETRLEETGGLGEYNLAIFNRYLEHLQKSVTRIADIHRRAYHIPRLRVWFLGDIVDNETIFPGQPHEIEQCVIDQMFMMADAFVTFLHQMLYVFDEVVVDCVAGNHGRIGKKGEAKYYVNWDYLLYRFMEARTANESRLRWNIPKAWFDLVDVGGWNFLLIHGDDIKSWNSIPYYGIDRADARWTKLLQRKNQMYHYLVMGDKHNQAQIDNVIGEKIVNGAWPGMSMFSLKQLQIASRPSQLMFGVHPSRGKTWSYKLYLDS